MKPTLPTNRGSLQETCLGVPFAHERLLTEAELTTLQDESRRSTRQSCSHGCAIAGVLLLLIVIAAVVGEIVGGHSIIQGVLTALVIVPTIGLPAFLLLRVNDLLKLRRAANLDLKIGYVKCYHGNLPGVSPDDLIPESLQVEVRETEADFVIGGISVALYRPISIEVLASSRRLWQVNNQKVLISMVLPEEITAPQPAHAEVAAKWAQPAIQVAENVLDTSQAGQRELSHEECEEIRRRAGKMWQRPALGASFLTLAVTTPLVLPWIQGSPIPLDPLTYFIITMVFLVNHNLAKNALWARQLIRDAKNGIVIVTRLPTLTSENEANAELSIDLKGPVVELLPISKWLWTQDGHPTPWRLQS